MEDISGCHVTQGLMVAPVVVIGLSAPDSALVTRCLWPNLTNGQKQQVGQMLTQGLSSVHAATVGYSQAVGLWDPRRGT